MFHYTFTILYILPNRCLLILFPPDNPHYVLHAMFIAPHYVFPAMQQFDRNCYCYSSDWSVSSGDAMRALYQHPTEAQLSEVVQEVENGHGGKVDFPEFIEILVSHLVIE